MVAQGVARRRPGHARLRLGDGCRGGGSVDGAVVTLTAPGGDRALPRWIRELADAGLDVVAATHRQPTLDDVFLALTGRSLREESAAPESAPANAAA